MPAPDRVTAEVELTVNGRRMAMRVSVPPGPVAPAELLPLYRGVADRLTAMAVGAARAAGREVSCRAGCGACCRQLVPVSALEARELMKVVARLPEPRRSEVRARFAEVRRRLADEAPGLLDRLLHAADRTPQEIMAMGREYFALALACPFLEGESCSVYDDRPVDCRQYLVVSPREYCSENASPRVEVIAPPGGPVSAAIPAAERTASGTPVAWVPLVLAPDFVADHPNEPPPRPAPQVVDEFFARFGKGGGDR